MSTRQEISNALQILGGSGYLDQIHKLTGIHRVNLCRVLNRMHSWNEVQMEFVQVGKYRASNERTIWKMRKKWSLVK